LSSPRALGLGGATRGSDGAGTPGTGNDDGGVKPFAVEPTFNPGGYFDKNATDITQTAGCTDLPAGLSAKASTCRTWTYAPDLTKNTATGQYFAGVFWHYGNQNWGTSEGAPIPPGYTNVTFWAKGAKGGEEVAFWVGGLAGKPYADKFQSPTPGPNGAVTPTKLTDQWVQYTISLAGADYSGGVLGGFAWSQLYEPDAGAPTPTTFYLVGIQWQ
jgi:hypothetical protein